MRDFYSPEACSITEFVALLDRSTAPDMVPRAARVVQNVPLYAAPEINHGLLAEWAWVLESGPGVLVIEGGVPHLSAIDSATEAFYAIIAEEQAGSQGRGDHFAASGANARIWNVHQKLCLRDPETYAMYCAAPLIDAVCRAWLGPGYQMTAQVNLVRPGSAAQDAHRDYHLGFQSAEVAQQFPRHAHHLSAVLTLQGGIAHCDMPVESGTTKLLPFSQTYGPGYLAYRLPEFRALFEDRFVQLPLAKGDAIFFNPALFHAAAQNRSSDIQRMANLLQISSPFGRAMESLDRDAMCRQIYPVLQELIAAGRLDQEGARAVIAMTAEGYAFPTNLDSDPPVGGNAPATQADLMTQALQDGARSEAFGEALTHYASRRMP